MENQEWSYLVLPCAKIWPQKNIKQILILLKAHQQQNNKLKKIKTINTITNTT